MSSFFLHTLQGFGNRNVYPVWSHIPGISSPSPETILIDVDDAETSDLLFSIVQDLGLKCRVYATTRGKHFYFRNPEGYVEKSWTKQTLALGIETDSKVGRNNSYAIMRFNGVDREIIQDCPEDEIQDLPKWLTPVKTNMKFLDMRAGDGRNQALFNYILTLQSEDFTKEEACETIRMINRYVLEVPLSDRELETILRDRPKLLTGAPASDLGYA